MPWSDTQFRERIHRGDVEATVTGHTYAIESRVLDRRTDIAPADPTDAHRWLVSPPRSGLWPTWPARNVANRARRARWTTSGRRRQCKGPQLRIGRGPVHLRHGPVVEGDRPLAVAQYAERSVDALGAAPSMASLDALVARIETNGTSRTSASTAPSSGGRRLPKSRLSRTIPSTQVMANIADLGAMMLAATHHLRTLEPHTTTEEIKDLTAQLRSGADALRRASTAWKSVSTLQPQSHEFGAASLELFNVMREVISAPTATGARQFDDPRRRSGAAQPRARSR